MPKSKASKKSKSVVKKEGENLIKNENVAAVKSKTPTRCQAAMLKKNGEKGLESSKKPKDSGLQEKVSSKKQVDAITDKTVPDIFV